jgi:hypothetical protein
LSGSKFRSDKLNNDISTSVIVVPLAGVTLTLPFKIASFCQTSLASFVFSSIVSTILLLMIGLPCSLGGLTIVSCSVTSAPCVTLIVYLPG